MAYVALAALIIQLIWSIGPKRFGSEQVYQIAMIYRDLPAAFICGFFTGLLFRNKPDILALFLIIIVKLVDIIMVPTAVTHLHFWNGVALAFVFATCGAQLSIFMLSRSGKREPVHPARAALAGFVLIVFVLIVITLTNLYKWSHIDEYIDAGQFDKAIEICSKAIELNSKDERAYLSRGFAYFQKNNNNAAISDFTKAIQLNPNNDSPYIFRGSALDKLGRQDEAINDFTKAIQRNPNNANLYIFRGLVYARKGDDKSAIDDCNKAINIRPNDPDVYYNIACIYSLLKEEDKACEFLKKAKIKGYSDINHLINDADLINIRQTQCFKTILDKKIK